MLISLCEESDEEIVLLPVMYFIISALSASSSFTFWFKRRPSASNTSTIFACVCCFLRRFCRDLRDASLFLTRRKSLLPPDFVARLLVVLVRWLGFGVGGKETSAAESQLAISSITCGKLATGGGTTACFWINAEMKKWVKKWYTQMSWLPFVQFPLRFPKAFWW